MQINSILIQTSLQSIHQHPLENIYVILTTYHHIYLFDAVTMQIVSKTDTPLPPSIPPKPTPPETTKKLKRLRKNNQSLDSIIQHNSTLKQSKNYQQNSSLNQAKISISNSIQQPNLKNISNSSSFNLNMCSSLDILPQNVIKQHNQSNIIPELLLDPRSNDMIDQNYNHQTYHPIKKSQTICLFQNNLNKFTIIDNTRVIKCQVDKGKINYECINIDWRNPQIDILIASGYLNQTKRLEITKYQIIIIDNTINNNLKLNLPDTKYNKTKNQTQLKLTSKNKSKEKKIEHQQIFSKTRLKKVKSNIKIDVEQKMQQNILQDNLQRIKKYNKLQFQYSVIMAKQCYYLNTWIIITSQYYLLHILIKNNVISILYKYKLVQFDLLSQSFQCSLQIHLHNRLPLIALYDFFVITIFQIDNHSRIQKITKVNLRNQKQQKIKYIQDVCFFKLGVNTSSIDRFQKQLYIVVLVGNQITSQLRVYSVNSFGNNLQHIIKVCDQQINRIWSSQYLQNSIMYVQNNKQIKMFNIVRSWSTSKNNGYEYFGSKEIISEWVSLGYRFQPLQQNQIYQQKEDQFDTMQTVKGRTQEQIKNQLDDWSYSFIQESQYWQNVIKRLDFTYQYYN